MVIWRIEGDAIGPNDCAAAHFPTLTEAKEAITQYKDWHKRNERNCYYSGPTKIIIKTNKQLARELDDAMGYGGN